MAGLFPLIYLALVIAIGLSHRKPMTGEADFFLARRSGSMLLLSGSLIATMLGSFGVMGMSSLGYRMGLVAVWYMWVGMAGLYVLGGWAIRRLPIRDVYTLPELLGRVYGAGVRQVSALLIVGAWLSIIAAQLIAAGKILLFLGVLSGWWTGEGATGAILTALVSVVFVVYTCLGGQHSILRTDLLQASLILIALIVVVFAAVSHEPGALSRLDPSFWAFPFSDSLPPAAWLTIALTFGVPFLVGPDIYSRLFSGRSEATGRGALFIAATVMIPTVLLIVLSGMLGNVLLEGQTIDRDLVLLHLARIVESPLWAGLLVAALLAAVMSSADTCLLTISTLVSRDILDTFLPGRRRESLVLMRSRLIIVLAGVLALAIALALQDIVSALMICYSLYSPAVLFPFLFLVIFPGRSFSPLAGMMAVLLGGGCAAAGILAGSEPLRLMAFGVSTVPLVADLILRRPAFRAV